MSGQRTSSNQPFNPQPDISINSGLSIPLGKYRLLTNQSDDRSSASYGGFVEVLSSITPMPSSPWRVNLTLGYFYNPFDAAASKEAYELPIMTGTDWHIVYTMLGVGYTSKKQFFYGIHFNAGILGFMGGDINSGQIENDTFELNAWAYSPKPAAAVKVTGMVGYSISPKISLYATIGLFYSATTRSGRKTTTYYEPTNQIQLEQPILHEKLIETENQTTIFALNIGLGFRYKFYEESSNLNYQLNIEENQ